MSQLVVIPTRNTPYEHANVLDEGPNTSKLPEPEGNALVGAFHILLAYVVIGAIAFLVKYLWRVL